MGAVISAGQDLAKPPPKRKAESALTDQTSPWWHPSLHGDRQPILKARGRIVDAVRRYFAAGDFTEVDCGMLQISPGNETHLHGFSTLAVAPGGERQELYLHTSPEFACKKLLAAGEERIFSLGHVFRNRERGPLHAPEFTMLEWYRAGEPYEAVMRDCAELMTAAAEAAGSPKLRWRGHEADPFLKPEYLTVAEAFAHHAGVDLLATLEANGQPIAQALAAAAKAIGLKHAPDDSWSDLFSRILVDRIEPKLGIGRPTVLYEYPACEAALAQLSSTDRRVAERFELYACGVELANGFGELTDAAEQRRRFQADMAEKERIYGERYPIDEDFLAALAHMPPASGVALGLDRLVMLVTGASRIDQVLWTPLS